MLSRKKPLLRKNTLKRSQTPIKRTPIKKKFYVIKKVSDKLAVDLALYYPMALAFKEKHYECQAGLYGCTRRTSDVHHIRGRGIWLIVVKFWLAVCRNCHDTIGDNHEIAKERGFSENRLQNFKLKDNS